MSSQSKVLPIVLVVVIIAIGGFLAYNFLMPAPVEEQPPEQPPQPPPQEQITLKVITRHGADILRKTEEAFLASPIAQKYKIVDIWWLPVGSPLWIDTIKTAGDVDVAWGGGPVLFDTLKREGLLKPLTGDILELINTLPDEISGSPMKRFDEEGNIVWVAAAISSFGFTVNEKFLNTYNLPWPTKWLNLANETYEMFSAGTSSPCVGVADAIRSTSNTRMYQIILQAYGWVEGWKIITLMAANAAIYDQSGLVRDAVMRGDIGVGITIDFYGYTAQLQAPVCTYVLPGDGTIVNGDPIALLSTSNHVEAALAFIEWVLSPEGQKVWLDPDINRLPINPKVFDTPEGQAREDLKQQYELTLEATTIEFSDELAISYENSLMWYFHSTLVEAQDRLREAWRMIVEAKKTGKITAAEFVQLIDELTNPLKLNFTDPLTQTTVSFTLEYAQKINDKLRTDPDFKLQMVRIWRDAATARYEAIIQKLSG